MKSWRPGTRHLKCSEIEAPIPGDDAVLVRVQAAALVPEDFRSSAAVAPGSALVGRVEATGSAATAFLGARVLVSAVSACGECATCRRGHAAVCPQRSVMGRDTDGGCAELVVTGARWLCKLDDSIEMSDEVAAVVAGPALDAYGLWCRSGMGAGDIAVILGHGPVAEILSELARVRGVKLADQALRADEQSAPRKIFVCAGGTVGEALAASTPGSTIAAHGSIDEEVDLRAMGAGELSLFAMPFAHPDLLPELAALVCKGELDLSERIASASLHAEIASDAAAAYAEGRTLVVHF